MKSNAIILFVLLYAVMMGGCATTPSGSDSNVAQKGELFLIKSEGICQEIKSGKMWQENKAGPFDSRAESEQYAADLKLGGHEDWRLPTTHELYNLFQMCFWKKNGDCVMDHRGEYWTVSVEQEPVLGHWESYMVCSPEFKYVKAIKHEGYVRAIRP